MPVGRPSGSGRFPSTVSFRVSRQERETIQKAAEAGGMSESEYLRKLALKSSSYSPEIYTLLRSNLYVMHVLRETFQAAVRREAFTEEGMRTLESEAVEYATTQVARHIHLLKQGGDA